MAINYTNLFEDIGECVEVVNNFMTLADTTLPAYESEIVTEFNGNSMFDLVGSVPGMFERYQGTVLGWIGPLNSKIQERLLDRTTILDELPLGTSSGIQAVLAHLYRQMIDDDEDINRSDVTVGATSSEMVGDSDGTVLTSKILDGVSSPGGGMPSNPYYAHDLSNAGEAGRLPGEHADYIGTYSELCKGSEDMVLICVGDSQQGGSVEGSERFSWVGGLKNSQAFHYDTEGSGTGTGVAVMNSISVVLNGEFENWSASAPSNWTIDSGIAGTDVLEETSTTKRGDSAIEFSTPTRAITAVSVADPTVLDCTAHGLAVGDEIFLAGFDTTPSVNGAQTVNTVPDVDTFTLDINVTVVADGVGTWKFDELQISQDLSNLVPGKRYVLGCWVQGQAGIASGVLTIQMEGTSYIAGTVEKISMDDAALAAQTSYGIEYFFFNAPIEMPSDFELVIKLTGTFTDAKSLYIDGLALTPVMWHGGVCIGILAGANPFLVGDTFTFNVANDDAGVFQTHFRKQFGIQLPSKDAPSIADALASD